MSKTNILLLSKLFPDRYKPLYGKLIQNLANGLQKRNDINLKVVKPIPWIPELLGVLGQRLKIYADHPEVISIDDTTIEYMRFIKIPGLFNYFEDRAILNSIIKQLKKTNFIPKVIYSHWPYPEGVVAYKLSKMLGSKTVVHFHAGNPKYFTENFRVKGLVSELLLKADQTIFVSRGILEETSKIFKINNPTYVYNGIDEQLFYRTNKQMIREKLQINKNTKVILSVGYLKSIKGMDLVLEAMSNIKDRDIVYYIVGWGDESEKLHKLADKYKILERVKFVGKVDNEAVSLYMQAADLFVLPSRMESFGQVFVESLMCGTPIIGTKVGGIPEIIQNEVNGFLIDPENVGQLANAIEKSLSRKWNEAEISATASKFTLQNMVNAVGDKLIEISKY